MSGQKIGFGIQAAQDAADYQTVEAFTLETEKLGYDSLWLCDHVFAVATDPSATMLESWTTLSALATKTRTLRLGVLVLCNSFRNPALMAKMAATLDVISNGRLEFGIGAGWFEKEYRAYGYDFPKPSVRIKQMSESIEICRRMWTEEAPSFTGKYYQIENAYCAPKPLQKPHPPVWVGGGGEQTLRVVAQHADKWNCPAVTPAELEEKIAVLEQRCSEAGRDPSQIEKTLYCNVIVDDEPRIGDTLQRRADRRSQTLDDFTARMIAGTPEQCIAKIEQYVSAGISYFTLNMGSLRDLRTPALFADRVLPSFR